jgi:hypothetical protein
MPPPNAANRKSIREAEKAAALAKLNDREAVGAIMSTLPGRAWMWRHLSLAHVFHTTFSPDPYASAFAEGQRSMGLALLDDIMAHCPEQYLQMTREANDRHISHQHPASTDSSAAAERRGGEIFDGGDSGAEPDQAGRAEDPAEWGPTLVDYT